MMDTLTSAAVTSSGPAEGQFPVALNGELAGLSRRAMTVQQKERIFSLDILRGFALLGILIMNIDDFGPGDILFEYGLNAAIFLYPFRIMKSRGLLLTGIFLVAAYSVGGAVYSNLPHRIYLQHQIDAIHVSQQIGRPLTSQQTQALQGWREIQEAHKPDSKANEAEMEVSRGGFMTYYKAHGGWRYLKGRRWLLFIQGVTLYSLSLMLIGMALFRCGFLTGELSYRVYLWTALVGSLISIPCRAIGVFKIYASGVYPVYNVWGLFLSAQQFGGTFAVTAMLLLLIKSGILRPLLWPVAAVGQMALSNYLLTTILCQFLFIWSPWRLYGRLEYYQLLYVVFGVWSINLVVSPFWLRFFRFGPMEWCWRSLTYWRVQPMRLRS